MSPQSAMTFTLNLIAERVQSLEARLRGHVHQQGRSDPLPEQAPTSLIGRVQALERAFDLMLAAQARFLWCSMQSSSCNNSSLPQAVTGCRGLLSIMSGLVWHVEVAHDCVWLVPVCIACCTPSASCCKMHSLQ